MTDATSPSALLVEISNPANRHDPYRLYEQFDGPVTRQDNDTYAVTGYHEIVQLLHDPRISSDLHNRNDPPANMPPVSPFIAQDPPNHDRLRRIAMSQFGPPGNPGLVLQQEPAIRRLVHEKISAMQAGTVDIVDDFAYPIPVAVICELLGVPPEDEAKFHEWADVIVESLDPDDQPDAEDLDTRGQDARIAIVGYLGELMAHHRAHPSDTMLSRLANESEGDPLDDLDLQVTSLLLLIAGHETTVNLIANGTLTLLRHPEHLARLRDDPEFAIPLVEELLRFEPPVQFLPNRTAATDLEVAGTTIPKGSKVALILGAGNRDPRVFREPNRFDPDRPDLQHLGFGGGIHYCFGAPLARIETQIALVGLAQRLIDPRLAADPPPYRPSPVLRGPRHLMVEIDGVHPEP
jgi:cytochrome P450